MNPRNTPEPTKPPRKQSATIAAAKLFDKLMADEQDEADEIGMTPALIRERHAKKRAEWLSAASEEVRELVTKMRAK
jgi:hypothetical protein